MKAFLTAFWKNLLFINYETEAQLLLPYLPKGVEIDYYNGKCFVSLVGFLFLNTKILGIAFPFHRHFEEFNLRFYVRRKENDEYKRGVVFVKEIVPRRIITRVAWLLYGERYYHYPMQNSYVEKDKVAEIEYAFLMDKRWNFVSTIIDKKSRPVITNTVEEFITEHYWGYTKLTNDKTSEYRVDHPRWNIHDVLSCKLDIDTKRLYGTDLHKCFSKQPVSVFLADGSPVTVFTRNILNG